MRSQWTSAPSRSGGVPRPSSSTSGENPGPVVVGLAFSAAPTPDADLWRERLFETVLPRYTMGVRERLGPLLGWLADRFGLGEIDLPRQKVTPLRPSMSETPESLRDLIRAHHWLDVELYDRCAELEPRVATERARSSSPRAARSSVSARRDAFSSERSTSTGAPE